jgi:asparagine synthase (glutamine-hydrolysing)
VARNSIKISKDDSLEILNMCGIFGILNNQSISMETIRTEFEKGRGRGPESFQLLNINIQAIFGFHRLAINGLNAASDQPIQIDDISLICNGEIYNYMELYKLMDVVPRTDSDCEVIIHLYLKYGIEHTLQLLDGVFAFALLDGRTALSESRLFLARDPYGVRPLYWLHLSGDGYSPKAKTAPSPPPHVVAFASEMKSLIRFAEEGGKDESAAIAHFPPGSFCEYSLTFRVNPQWTGGQIRSYHTPGFSASDWIFTHYKEDVYERIQQYFIAAVEKRCVTTERPIACLLSGGLDSSLVAALVQRFHKSHGLPPIETFSIGLADSEDLHFARMVSKHIGSIHKEVILTETDFICSIPEVIEAIESYDTTTVRASIGNYLLGKYIKENSSAKVIFNGDGSDELMGGYLYMHACPDALEFDRESRRLLSDIHLFDVLRSDKSISSHGLEPRTPFLDRAWVQMYLSLPPTMRYTVIGNGFCEKTLIRKAFSQEMFDNGEKPLLPKDILWRRKEAFSDGVSCQGRSLYEILQEFTNMMISESMVSNAPWEFNRPRTQEQYYYRSIFEQAYPGQGGIVPYFWMPKYVKAKDASARTLAIYSTVA